MSGCGNLAGNVSTFATKAMGNFEMHELTKDNIDSDILGATDGLDITDLSGEKSHGTSEDARNGTFRKLEVHGPDDPVAHYNEETRRIRDSLQDPTGRLLHQLPCPYGGLNGPAPVGSGNQARHGLA